MVVEWICCVCITKYRTQITRWKYINNKEMHSLPLKPNRSHSAFSVDCREEQTVVAIAIAGRSSMNPEWLDLGKSKKRL